MLKKKKNDDSMVELYGALNLIMNECSLHGSCSSDCPLYDEEWKCIRNMPPAYWKAFAPTIFDKAREELPVDKLISFSCDGCVDQVSCDINDALSSVGFKVEDLGCSKYRGRK